MTAGVGIAAESHSCTFLQHCPHRQHMVQTHFVPFFNLKAGLFLEWNGLSACNLNFVEAVLCGTTTNCV